MKKHQPATASPDVSAQRPAPAARPALPHTPTIGRLLLAAALLAALMPAARAQTTSTSTPPPTPTSTAASADHPQATASTPAPAGTAMPHAGFIKSVEGEVQLVSPGGDTRRARAGDAIAPSDRLLTGTHSGAGVVLRDGTTLVVGPSSRMDLRDFSFDATTQDGNLFVALVRGSLRVITGLIGKLRPEAVRIETQTATISIRGTDFAVDAEDAL